MHNKDTNKNVASRADLPNPGQISQVEDIVELGWSGQHLDLHLLP